MEFPQRMSMWVFCFVGIWNSTFIVFNMISNQFRYTSFMIGLSLPLVAVVGVVAGVLVFTLLHFRRPRWWRRHRFYQHISICVLKIFSLCSFMHLARSTFFRCVSFSLPLASYMLSLSIGLSVCLSRCFCTRYMTNDHFNHFNYSSIHYGQSRERLSSCRLPCSCCRCCRCCCRCFFVQSPLLNDYYCLF